MEDDRSEEIGGFDAKNNERKPSKDAAGKAIGYEDAATRKREDQSETHTDGMEKD